MNYEFSFFYVWQGMPKLLEGLWLTLELTLLANAIGLTAGFVVALGMMSKNKFIQYPVIGFIEFFRTTPALIQIIWFFFCVPLVFNVWWSPLFMGILALGLNVTAFNAEAYRAAIQAIPDAHDDAGIALGMTKLERIRYIILPQAARIATPVLITNAIGIFQQSALVSLISIEELMYQGRLIASETFRPIETLTTVALMYFAISFPVSQLVSWMEKRNTRMTAR